jgi:hypothetical protein
MRRSPLAPARLLQVAALVLPALACGGGPVLSGLRCRTDPCQHPEQPLTMRLAVDFEDPSGTLGRGSMELRLNGKTQSAFSLGDLFATQRVAPGATQGTIQFDQDFSPDALGAGTTLSSSVLAHDGDGRTSNEPTLDFRVNLVGP